MKKVFISKCPIGLFVFTDAGELEYFSLYKKDPKKAVEEFVKEDKIKSMYENCEIEYNNSFIRKKMREYALSLGFCKDEKELNDFLAGFCYELSKMNVKGFVTKDKFIIQAYNAFVDIKRALNLLEERVREWYKIHYPEVDESKIVMFVSEYGMREKIPGFTDSVGLGLEKNDINIIKEYAEIILLLNKRKKSLENYVKKEISKLMPNFSSLVEPLLAAQILSLAGSLEKLAKLPASSIQLIGAEKALFRHLHKKGRSPKYGVIYNSSFIQNAPDDKKGKCARILASKLMLAIRADYYSKRDIRKELQENLKKELKKVIK